MRGTSGGWGYEEMIRKKWIFKRRFALQAAFVFWDYEAGGCARVYIKKTEGSR